MSRYFRRSSFFKGGRRRASWHRYAMTYRGGATKARCGYWTSEEPEWSDSPSLNEKGCETCLRLTLRDEDASVVENDPVGNEPPVEDDPVPG